MGLGSKGYHLVEFCKTKVEAQRLAKQYRAKGWASVRIQKGRIFSTSPWYYTIYVKGRKVLRKKKS